MNRVHCAALLILPQEITFHSRRAFSPDEKKNEKKMPCPEKSRNERKRRFSYEISVIDVKERFTFRGSFLFLFAAFFFVAKTITVNFFFFSLALQNKNIQDILRSKSCSHVDERAVTNLDTKNQARVNDTRPEKYLQTPENHHRRNFPLSCLKNHHQCPGR